MDRPPVRPKGWWWDGLLVVGFTAVTLGLAYLGPLRELDLEVLRWVDGHRPPGGVADLVAQVLNRLGQGGVLAGVAACLALLLIWHTRSAWPAVPVVAAFLATGIVLLPIKLYFHRAAPHAVVADEIKVRLFSEPGSGLSYPSGHAVNTIVWYGVLALLLSTWLAGRPRVTAVLRFVPPTVVGVTATYLGYHWLTDMLAGLFLGLLLDRALTRLSAPIKDKWHRKTGEPAPIRP